MQCKALVVDDEPLARVRLKALLEPYASELEVVGEASSGEQAIEKIRELDPDVVFLDIQMPDMDAFDVLKNIDEDDMPLIVFTTAYENFALRAYEENTVDYLLKPVDSERLKNTMEKLRRSLPNVDSQQQMPADFTWDRFREMISARGSYLQRIQVKIGDRILLVNVDEMEYFSHYELFCINKPLGIMLKKNDNVIRFKNLGKVRINAGSF